MTATIQFLAPARVVFGRGAIDSAGTEALRLGRKALVVTGRDSAGRSGGLRKLTQSLTAAGVAFAHYDAVRSDPDAATVDAGAAAFRREGCDIVIGLGGGSPLDAAKAIAFMARREGSILDAAGHAADAPAGSVPPVLAIPTTAGTGSEISRYAVITDARREAKLLLGGPALVPAVALLDPLLTVSLPPAVTAGTGMDALTHACEAYLSRRASALTDPLALAAVQDIARNLGRAVAAPDDLDAREAMLRGQMFAGYAFSNASTALVHGMARPLGARFHLPHGTATALLLAPVLAFNLPACPERMANLARAMGYGGRGVPPQEAGKGAVMFVKELAATLPLPRNLSAFGVTPRDLSRLADETLESGSTANNPRLPTRAEVLGLFDGLL